MANIAPPHIQDALEFSTTHLTWVVSAYTLTFAGLLLLGARAGDILGRRRVLMTRILLFTLSAGGGAIGLAGRGRPPPPRGVAAAPGPGGRGGRPLARP
ncbi:MFS transporter, partial [Streptomyces sp. NPDC059629]|uniref:MFS transporter n=1 Tax=Streptomyces sp. NPDC059629 TaxID=3346889 RepID=UPI0036B62FF9